MYDSTYFATAYRDYAAQHPQRKLQHYVDAVHRHEPDGRSVLDIGCAFGEFLGAFSSSWERVGCDLSAYALAEATQRWPFVRFVTMHAKLPIAGTFDAITAWDVLEHVPELDALLAQIADHLGGTFLFAVPVYDGPLGPLVRLFDHDPTHCHRRSRHWWLAKAKQHFTVLDWWGIFRGLLPCGYYLHRPTRRLRCIAPVICVAARRL